MRALFFCGHRSRYGLAHLEPILTSRFDIAAVIVGTDHRWKTFRKALRGDARDFSDTRSSFQDRLYGSLRRLKHRILANRDDSFSHLKSACGDIPVLKCEDVNSDESLSTWKDFAPDLIISAAYPQIFGSGLLSVPSVDSVNFHPSALPKFRGAHPHYWAIREAAEKTGVTVHQMTTRLDAGSIIAQREFPCSDLTYSELYDRIVEETPAIVSDLEGFFLEGNGELTPQDDSAATYYRNDRSIHNRIFWDRFTHEDCYNLIRTEKAFCFFGREKIRITKGHPLQSNRNMTNDITVPAGTIVDIAPDGIVVRAEEGFLCIEQVEFRRNTLSPLELADALYLGIGEVLT